MTVNLVRYQSSEKNLVHRIYLATLLMSRMFRICWVGMRYSWWPTFRTLYSQTNSDDTYILCGGILMWKTPIVSQSQSLTSVWNSLNKFTYTIQSTYILELNCKGLSTPSESRSKSEKDQRASEKDQGINSKHQRKFSLSRSLSLGLNTA